MAEHALIMREAVEADVPAVVALLADDRLGRAREIDDLAPYRAAFARMGGGNRLYVGERDGAVVATYQLTFIDGLSLRAARRAQIEGVRVASHLRGRGLGHALIEDAQARARAAGCSLVQLTANAGRSEAHAFYRDLGFRDTHLGFKLEL